MLLKISRHLDQEKASMAELANDIALDARLTAMLDILLYSWAAAGTE